MKVTTLLYLEFDRVAQRGESEQFDFRAVNQTHFHQPNRDGVVTDDVEDTGPLTFPQPVQCRHDNGSTSTTAASSPRKLTRWLFTATMHGQPG